jgi:hypothetical protein
MGYTGKMGVAFKLLVKIKWEDICALAWMELGPREVLCAHCYGFHKMHLIY